MFQAEVFEISCSFWLLDVDLAPQKFYFYSDIQAALRAFIRQVITSQTALDCVRNLNQLGRRHIVHLSWISGHSGFSGKELTDRMANLGSSTLPVVSQPVLPVPTSVVNLD